jgi:hypothetical protein
MLAAITGTGTAAETLPKFHVRSIPFSKSLNTGDRIGHIRIHGILELPSINYQGIRFSQLSDLAWDEDNDMLYAVSDKGALFWLKPVIQNNILTDLRLVNGFRLSETRTAIGSEGSKTKLSVTKPLRGARIDAEGMDIINARNGIKGDEQLLISFERFPRIVSHSLEGIAQREYPLPAPLQETKKYRDGNKMLEAVCFSPVHGILTAPEAGLKNEPEGYTHIVSLSGKSWRYPIENGSHIVSLVSFGEKGLFVLERDFSTALGRALTRLKIIALLPDVPDTVVVIPQSVAILDSKDSLFLDNFEGLTHHHENYYFMISDNNDIFLQRTLLLYFELLED